MKKQTKGLNKVITYKTKKVDIHNINKIYLVRFYENNKFLFSKVGTTKRTVKTRVKEEIKAYEKSGYVITEVKIIDFIKVENEALALGVECQLKARLIKKHQNDFIKNDRFTIKIKKDEFQKIVKKYL